MKIMKQMLCVLAFAVAVMIPVTAMAQGNPATSLFDSSNTFEVTASAPSTSPVQSLSGTIDASGYSTLYLWLSHSASCSTVEYAVLGSETGVEISYGTLTQSVNATGNAAGIYTVTPLPKYIKLQVTAAAAEASPTCTVTVIAHLLTYSTQLIVSGNQKDTTSGSKNVYPVLIGGLQKSHYGNNIRTVKTTLSGAIDSRSWAPAPADPNVIAVSTTAACVGPSDCATTATLESSCFRVSCNVDVSYAIGVGAPPTVTAASNDLSARTVEKICFPIGYGWLGFITSTGSGTCKVAQVLDN